MQNAVIWGTGVYGKKVGDIFIRWYSNGDINILGYTNSYNDRETVCGYPFFEKEKIDFEKVDMLCIAVRDKEVFEEIKNSICKKIRKEKIYSFYRFLNELRRRKILRTYNDVGLENEFSDILEYLKDHELTVRNNYENKDVVRYEVFRDAENGYPYIIFRGHRMFYPLNRRFEQDEEGKQFVCNVVEADQYPGSPHLYIHSEHSVREGDIIVDAGAAEGNFVMSWIDKIRKAYVFEGDKEWLKALRLTIKPFKNKVCLIPKYLSDVDSDTHTTLDSAIFEPVDFVKMDIEGDECKALLGGIELLKRSNAKLSICAYHRQHDAKYLSFLLNAMGYRFSYSNGWMFFCYDKYIDQTLDFRRGVLYGDKKEEVSIA